MRNVIYLVRKNNFGIYNNSLGIHNNIVLDELELIRFKISLLRSILFGIN